MFKLKSNDIKDFPFQDYSELNPSQMEDLSKTHYLTAHNSWMLPQIAAHYGQWQLIFCNNKIDSQKTAKKNITTKWDLGLWRVVTQLKRGSLVKSQINPEFASYSALVPLILMGAKKYKSIKYSQWDIDAQTRLVDENLRDAMFWQPSDGIDGILTHCPSYGLGSEELLDLRETGLMVKSGPKAGTSAPPTSVWCLRGMQNTVLATAPKLVTTMLAQVWVAHPTLRTEYMILDPNAWDSMPPALIDTQVWKTAPTVTTKKPRETGFLPWES
jgi:hypothetical protein